MKIIHSNDKEALTKLLRNRESQLTDAERIARRIIENVRRDGDRSLVRFSRKLDGIDLAKVGFTVSKPEISQAYKEIPDGFMAALQMAARNIRVAASRRNAKFCLPRTIFSNARLMAILISSTSPGLLRI